MVDDALQLYDRFSIKSYTQALTFSILKKGLENIPAGDTSMHSAMYILSFSLFANILFNFSVPCHFAHFVLDVPAVTL